MFCVVSTVDPPSADLLKERYHERMQDVRQIQADVVELLFCHTISLHDIGKFMRAPHFVSDESLAEMMCVHELPHHASVIGTHIYIHSWAVKCPQMEGFLVLIIRKSERSGEGSWKTFWMETLSLFITLAKGWILGQDTNKILMLAKDLLASSQQEFWILDESLFYMVPSPNCHWTCKRSFS